MLVGLNPRRVTQNIHKMHRRAAFGIIVACTCRVATGTASGAAGVNVTPTNPSRSRSYCEDPAWLQTAHRISLESRVLRGQSMYQLMPVAGVPVLDDRSRLLLRGQVVPSWQGPPGLNTPATGTETGVARCAHLSRESKDHWLVSAVAAVARPAMRLVFAVASVLGAAVWLLAVQTAAQCGPDKDKPYPAGSSTCPPPPGGAAPGPSASGGSGELCDICGASATYAEAILDSGGKKKRTITSSGCANHYSVCTGKSGISGCAAVGKEGSATEAKVQAKVVDIPAEPVIASTPLADRRIECQMGAIAIALNGVSIYGGAVDTSCNKVETGDETSEWTSFDMCAGHSQMQGDYHYHFPPSCLLAQAVASNAPTGDAQGHSPQLGWSFDGFPVYGPLYTGGSAVTGLDDCGGKEEEIPALDGFKYRYYFTGATSNLYALPGHPKPESSTDYPFAFNCYKGCTWEKLSAGSCTGASGVASGYVAAATTGYTTPFAQYGSSSGTNFKGETYQSAFITAGKCLGSTSAPASSPTSTSSSTSSSPSSASSSSTPVVKTTLLICSALLVSILQMSS